MTFRKISSWIDKKKADARFKEAGPGTAGVPGSFVQGSRW